MISSVVDEMNVRARHKVLTKSSIPNIITIGRICGAFGVLWFLTNADRDHSYFQWAFGIFVLAGISDYLDGFLARRFQWQSAVGKYFDPIADKTLVYCTLFPLNFYDVVPTFLIIIFAVYDISIILLNFIVKEDGGDSPITWLAKCKTAIQFMFLAGGILIAMNIPIEAHQLALWNGAVWIVGVLTALTALHYWWIYYFR